ncbi:hypothetical protein LXL04_007014 [Taraxacum kok-saghyz]
MSTTGIKFSRGDVSDRFKSTTLSNIENQHPAKSCSLRWVYVISRRNCRYLRLLFNGATILAAALFCSNFGDVWLVFRWERRKVLLHKEKQERQTMSLIALMRFTIMVPALLYVRNTSQTSRSTFDSSTTLRSSALDIQRPSTRNRPALLRGGVPREEMALPAARSSSSTAFYDRTE